MIKTTPSRAPLKLIAENMSLPNILSMSRVFCIPVIVFCVFHTREHEYCRYIAFVTILLAGVSDIFDGYLARKRNQMSKLGYYLDSITDKLLLITVCVILSIDNLWPEPRFPNWLPIIVIIKNSVVTFGALTVKRLTGQTLTATIFGKMSTFLLSAAIISAFLNNLVPLNLTISLYWAAAAATLIAATHYTWHGISVGLKNRHRLRI